MVKDDKRGYRSWWWTLPAAAALALVAAAVLMALPGRTPSASAAACALTITKTADVSKVPEEGNIVYTLTVKNTSVDTACTNVLVTDHIVDDLDCTSTTEPAGFVQAGCAGVAGDPVTWSAATLAFNTTATLTMSVKLGSGADDGESISNTANVSATGVVDPVISTAAVVAVSDCDLAISKSDDPSTVAPDGQITYTIKVTNDGTVDCTAAITVTDGIPTDTDCVSIDVTDDNGLDINFDEDDCDSSGDVVWDTDDTLKDGDDFSVQMVVELTSGAEDGDTIENVACVQATGFPEKCDTETTKVDEDVVTKTPTPGPTATAAPTATVRPVVPVAPPVAPAPPAPSAGLAPTLVAPLTGTGTAAGGSLPLALALGLAGGCLLLLGGVAMLRRPR